MFPKATVQEKQDKKETMVYIVGEKDLQQVALVRTSRTEVKRAVICACAVVFTTLILVGGTLGAMTLWLSFHHTPHDGHHIGGKGHGVNSPTSGVNVDNGGLGSLGDKGYSDVTESFTEVPGTVTDVGDILIDETDRGSSQSEATTPKPSRSRTTAMTPSVVDTSDSSVWESFSAPISIFPEPLPGDDSDGGTPESAIDWSSGPGTGSGSGAIPDEESEDYEEIPYRSSVHSYYSSSFPEASYDSVYDPGTYNIGDDQDWVWNGASGSGSGDMENSGDTFVYGFDDTLYTEDDVARPQLKTPQEFTVVRYPVPVSHYGTLCVSDVCNVVYTKGNTNRIEVIETDLQMKPRKLIVLDEDGRTSFTLIRDDQQGYRAILLDASGLCLLTRLEDTENLDFRQNSAAPIVEKLRVTLPVELPEQLLSQIGGPITDACRHVPVFWAQQVGDADALSFVNRIRLRRSPPSRGDPDAGALTLGGGIYFQCCWCADADDPCPCECGKF